MSPCKATALNSCRFNDDNKVAISLLRLQKITALLISSERNKARNCSRFCLACVQIRRAVMVEAVAAGGATEITFGFITNLLPIFLISSDNVAEKNKVWRIIDKVETIRSTSGIKPISSMRSASSITRIFTS